MPRPSANRHGFTLVGTMVSFALVGIVSLIFAEMMSNNFKAQRGLDTLDAAKDLKNEIQSLLADATSCQASFITMNPTAGAAVPVVRNTGSTIQYVAGQTYESGRVNLASMQLHGYVASSGNPLTGIATLTLNMTPTGQTFGAQQFRRDLQVNVTLNAAAPGGTVVGCSVMGGLSDSLWQVVPTTIGTANQLIYYNAGNVGIGTNAPAATLHVAGVTQTANLRIPGGTQGQILASSDNSGNAAWKNSGVSTAEDGNLPLTSTGTASAFYTNYVSLSTGVYLIDFYNCLDDANPQYFQYTTAQAASGSISTGQFVFQQAQLKWYNGNIFIMKVLSPTATVRFTVAHGWGGTITYGTYACASFYYTKLASM